MGWLDKTFKKIIKSDVGKAALLGAGAYFGGPGIMSALGGAGGKAGGMGLLKSLWAKPLISKPLTNAAMSYGLAKLMRSRNPEKAAMWGALSTLPFLGSSAYGHAADLTKQGMTAGGKDVSMWDVLLNRDVNRPSKIISEAAVPFQLSDINPNYLNEAARENVLTQLNKEALGPGKWGFDVSLKSKPILTGAADDYSYFMKSAAEKTAMNKAAEKATGLAQFMPQTDYNLLRTGLPLMAGTYGGRETDAQAWDRKRKQRIQQLAWMYGVDPSKITGEMTNPWYDITPPSTDWKYANQGGIMDLDAGGDVSGPGTSTSDSINAKLSDGEFVMTAKAVENFGGGDRQAGARKMYSLMNQLDPQSQTAVEGMV
jgi:hypothetical protein